MAQTPALLYADGDTIEYTEPSTDRTSGDVLVSNVAIPGHVVGDIDYSVQPAGNVQVEGVVKFPQAAEIIPLGGDVYWDADGSPYGGTSGSGAATGTASGNEYLGICLEATTTTTTHVKVKRILRPRLIRLAVASVNANGGNIATAGALAEGINFISGADNSKGVQLPSCVAGALCIVVNQNTDKTVALYPPLGKEINGAGANNSISMAANTADILWAKDTNTWHGVTASLDLS